MRNFWPVILATLLGGCLASSQPTEDLAAVQIVRDEYGVPHIYADDLYGLYFGYGHAIAQDRLFQMEMARRSTQGKVAEVLGPAFIEYDRNTRTLFSPESIRQQISALAPQDSVIFSAYAAGINHWLDAIDEQPQALMPKQFLDLDTRPLRWTAYDVVMIFVGTMNNRYGDFNTELENAATLAELTTLHDLGSQRYCRPVRRAVD
ncbi:MAG: penicillin acylase family protein [Lysobacterales bacterium]